MMPWKRTLPSFAYTVKSSPSLRYSRPSYFQCPSSVTKPSCCIAHQPPSVPVSLKRKQTPFISFVISRLQKLQSSLANSESFLPQDSLFRDSVNRPPAAHAPQSTAPPVLIDLSVPCPTLTLVAQHAVVTMNGELYRCIDAEHTLFVGLSAPFPGSSGAFIAPSKYVCARCQQELPTSQINSAFQLSS